MWQAVNLSHKFFDIFDNRAQALTHHLNEIGATYFVLLSEDSGGDISGIAWVEK